MRGVGADLGKRSFCSGKEFNEHLAKEGKEMAKYWENPECHRNPRRTEFLGGQLCEMFP